MSYSPQPGTIAYRAVAWLEKQDRGSEFTMSVWAEAIDTDATTLGPCIKPALAVGLVKERTRDGLAKPKWYSLGDGQAPQPVVPDGEDTRDPLPPRTSAPEVKPAPGQVLPGVGINTRAPLCDGCTRSECVEGGCKEPVREPKREPARIEVPTFLPQPQQAPQKPQADDKPIPFDCWLSGVSSELVLQGVQTNDEGDLVLTAEQVAAVRALLTGTA